MVDNHIKEKARKSYSSAIASFNAMVGAEDPELAKAVAKEGGNLMQDYQLFWEEEGIDDDKRLEKTLLER